ncbi:MAG: hypothetical protein Tp172DCM1112201_41 [Prokaryotic dsDNA virus sp.]|nr:MAG: hypothetical protein Tp172DCM1112201_41 [Prokaryotic dsDNA virus sp.]|tara:strand:+ start:2150 stop:2407 length:258 start_codon:yes stop_codon:yes gene_type:complete
MARNYRQEYDRYQGSPAQKKRRAMRNKARRQAMRDGRVRKGDGRDVHHRNGNPMDSSPDNLQIRSASSNRSYARNKKAGKKSKYA